MAVHARYAERLMGGPVDGGCPRRSFLLATVALVALEGVGRVRSYPPRFRLLATWTVAASFANPLAGQEADSGTPETPTRTHLGWVVVGAYGVAGWGPGFGLRLHRPGPSFVRATVFDLALYSSSPSWVAVTADAHRGLDAFRVGLGVVVVIEGGELWTGPGVVARLENRHRPGALRLSVAHSYYWTTGGWIPFLTVELGRH